MIVAIVDGFCECMDCGKRIEGMQPIRNDQFICRSCAEPKAVKEIKLKSLLTNVKEALKSNNIHATITESALSSYNGFEVSITLGSNEGYYINVLNNLEAVHIRFHDKFEAVHCLNCLIVLIPRN